MTSPAVRSAFAFVAKYFQRLNLPPMISLPNSGIKQISLWTILVVAYIGGVFSGFLGGGAGYIRMPAMVYILGVPTHVAVGTDLFELRAPVALNIVCFGLKASGDGELNKAIVLSLHDSGLAAPSTTVIDGKAVIRAAIVNHRTTRADIDQFVAALHDAAGRISP